MPTVVVQPDIIVVLNDRAHSITPDRIIGAPDLVVEVLAPNTAGHDQRIKQDAYARASVHEYWLAGPAARTVEVLWLAGSAYHSQGVCQARPALPSQVIPTLSVHME